MGLGIVGHAPIVINYTISATDTWEQVTGTPVAGPRKWLIKARESTFNQFDLAFEDTAPSAHLTSDGSGFSWDNCDLPPVFVRTSTAGTTFELIYWG